MAWQAHVYGEAPAEVTEACAARGLALHVFGWGENARRSGLALVVKMGRQRVRPSGSETVIGLPHRRQRGRKVAAAAPRLKPSAGVVPAQPHRHAVGQLQALRLAFGAIHTDRAHRLRGRHIASLVQGGRRHPRHTHQCEAWDVPGGCRGVARVSGNCK